MTTLKHVNILKSLINFNDLKELQNPYFYAESVMCGTGQNGCN